MNDATKNGDRELTRVPDSAPPAVIQPDQVWKIGAFDMGKFEAIGKLAAVMATMPILPESLRGVREGRDFTAFDKEQIAGNCFLICTIADRWSANGYVVDPLMLAQATSIVRGKLMFEGKVIHAALEALLGIELDYEIFDAGKGDQMGVTVTGRLSGDRVRTVQGTVRDWRTTGDKSPWANPSAFERMLCYRGAREWARRWKPGVMIGFIAEDEFSDDDLESRAQSARTVGEQRAGLPERLAARKSSEGFAAPQRLTEHEAVRAAAPAEEETTAGKRTDDAPPSGEPAYALNKDGSVTDPATGEVLGAKEPEAVQAHARERARLEQQGQVGLDLDPEPSAPAPQTKAAEEPETQGDASGVDAGQLKAYAEGLFRATSAASLDTLDAQFFEKRGTTPPAKGDPDFKAFGSVYMAHKQRIERGLKGDEAAAVVQTALGKWSA